MVVDAHALYRQAYQSFQAATADLKILQEEYIRSREPVIAARADELIEQIPSLLEAASKKGWIEDVLVRCDPVEPCSPYIYSAEHELDLLRSLEDRLVAEEIAKRLVDDKSVKVRRRHWTYTDSPSFSGFDLLVTVNISTDQRAAIRAAINEETR